MKLSKLYSNRPDILGPITFNSGINVVLAEIRLPKNRNRDTHNLGKTTLGKLIDFCLLADRDPDFFLFKHERQFERFIFYLEIELLDGNYITIRRGVAQATKISFKRHTSGKQDFVNLPELKWDQVEIPFEKAKVILDGMLDLRILKKWGFRKGLGYLLRSQEDFRDVFQLRKFAFVHSDWKPFLAHMLGFNASLVTGLYEKEAELSEVGTKIQTIESELGGSIEDISKIEGMLLLKQKEAARKQDLLNSFDLRTADKDKTKSVVDEMDSRIAELNARRYSLNVARKKIQVSLNEDQMLFDPSDAARLFSEVGVLFPDQLKKDYDQLLSFNRAITDERRVFLKEEQSEVDVQLKLIGVELNHLGKRRSSALAFLTDSDIFTKYREVSGELVDLKADISVLERRRGYLSRLQELRSQVRKLSEAKGRLQVQIEKDVETQNKDRASLFSSIRVYFSEILEDAINRKALLSVAPNRLGHLEFRAEILDESGNETSAGLGHTYRKLLCVAFDMAVLRAHLTEKAPRFLYHDGIFESLDDRKKVNLVGIMRKYSELGFQFVVTLIDSELPTTQPDDPILFSDDEIVLRLHDEGLDGRLFRMESW